MWEDRYPKYVLLNAELKVLELLESDHAVFYECDRDGNNRFTDLRYHNRENLESYVRGLAARLGVQHE